MRNSLALLGYLTIFVAPLAISTTFARDMDNGAVDPTYNGTTTPTTTTYYNNDGTMDHGDANREHPTTAAMPRHSYIHGEQFVANPTEMTNTRDNRGAVYNPDANYVPASAVNTVSPMTTTYQQPAHQAMPGENTTYSTTTYSH